MAILQAARLVLAGLNAAHERSMHPRRNILANVDQEQPSTFHRPAAMPRRLYIPLHLLIPHPAPGNLPAPRSHLRPPNHRPRPPHPRRPPHRRLPRPRPRHAHQLDPAAAPLADGAARSAAASGLDRDFSPPRPSPVFATAAAAAAGRRSGDAVAAAVAPHLALRQPRASVVLGLGAAPDRDYEGVGGWRLVDDGPAGGSAGRGGGGDGDRGGGDGDEATWVGWSSRPEPSASGGALGRPRSLTASSASAATMLQDRARRGAAAAAGAMSVEREDEGGYFGQTHELKGPTSGSVTTSLDDDEVNHHDFSKS